jgi:hypothetical protein
MTRTELSFPDAVERDNGQRDAEVEAEAEAEAQAHVGDESGFDFDEGTTSEAPVEATAAAAAATATAAAGEIPRDLVDGDPTGQRALLAVLEEIGKKRPCDCYPRARAVRPFLLSFARSGTQLSVRGPDRRRQYVSWPGIGLVPLSVASIGNLQFSMWMVDLAESQSTWTGEVILRLQAALGRGEICHLFRVFDPVGVYLAAASGSLEAPRELLCRLAQGLEAGSNEPLPLVPTFGHEGAALSQFTLMLSPWMMTMFGRFSRRRWAGPHRVENWALFARCAGLEYDGVVPVSQVTPAAIPHITLALVGAYLAFTGHARVRHPLVRFVDARTMARYQGQFFRPGVATDEVSLSYPLQVVQSLHWRFNVRWYDVGDGVPAGVTWYIYRTETDLAAMELVAPIPADIEVDVVWRHVHRRSMTLPQGAAVALIGFDRFSVKDLAHFLHVCSATDDDGCQLYVSENVHIAPASVWGGMGKASVYVGHGLVPAPQHWIPWAPADDADVLAYDSTRPELALYYSVGYSCRAIHCERHGLSEVLARLAHQPEPVICLQTGVLSMQFMTSEQEYIPALYKCVQQALGCTERGPIDFGLLVSGMPVIYDLAANARLEIVEFESRTSLRSFSLYLGGHILGSQVPIYRPDCDVFHGGIDLRDGFDVPDFARLPRNAMVHLLGHGAPPTISKLGILVVNSARFTYESLITAASSCLSLVIVNVGGAPLRKLPVPDSDFSYSPWYSAR